MTTKVITLYPITTSVDISTNDRTASTHVVVATVVDNPDQEAELFELMSRDFFSVDG